MSLRGTEILCPWMPLYKNANLLRNFVVCQDVASLGGLCSPPLPKFSWSSPWTINHWLCTWPKAWVKLKFHELTCENHMQCQLSTKRNCWNIRSRGHFFLIWPIFSRLHNVARKQKPGGTARGPPHKYTPRHWKVKGPFKPIQGSLYDTKPNGAGEIPQMYHTLALFDPLTNRRIFHDFFVISSSLVKLRPSGRSQIAWDPESRRWEFRPT